MSDDEPQEPGNPAGNPATPLPRIPHRRPTRSCCAAPGSPTAAPSTSGWQAAASRPSAPPAASRPAAAGCGTRIDLAG